MFHSAVKARRGRAERGPVRPVGCMRGLGSYGEPASYA
jgi:hypothetical protein